ncbi:hypothetical protein MiSe_24900 [Microseira wollei NIES-4236]|uniref:Uncharacterized protein n=1 Tax=Microseira wollei NIES-4236 TaxID=2530354 RepID=A0AAV3XAU0_9CYAN|nr:hypothetical protein MiSe_24900 [Microseira wollei NIES-4236]
MRMRSLRGLGVTEETHLQNIRRSRSVPEAYRTSVAEAYPKISFYRFKYSFFTSLKALSIRKLISSKVLITWAST